MTLNIFDLDGTLIDSSHRVALRSDGSFDLEHWIHNNTRENVFKDNLIDEMVEVYKAHRQETNIVVTSRYIQQHDIDFLNHHGLVFHDILHRNDSSRLKGFYEFRHILRPDYLKNVLTREYMTQNTHFKPGRAYDDHKANVEVFKSHGFDAILVDFKKT